MNCKEGTTFLSSREASNDARTGEYIFEYVDKCIEEIGPAKVIQVVTDNASNNMATADLLKGEEAKHVLDFMCHSHIEPHA